MSTYWDLWCETCGARVLDLHTNHGESSISGLIADMPHLIALAHFRPKVLVNIRDTYNIFGEGEDSYSIPVARFLPHENHNLRPKNEYGRWSDQCGQDVVCATCSTRKPCDLLYGHSGEHALKGEM